MSCKRSAKIMQDLPGTDGRILARYVRNVQKFCRILARFLPRSCMIFLVRGGGGGGGGGSIINRCAFHSAKATHLLVVAYSVLQYLLSLVEN